MKEIRGTNNKILEVNLSKKSVEVYTVVYGERYLFLGAEGLGLKLLFDRLTPGWDGLLIKGRAQFPTYLQITEKGVGFMDAAAHLEREGPVGQAV